MLEKLSKIFLSGLFFLVPFLFLILILKKVIHYWHEISNRLIDFFNLKSTIAVLGYSFFILLLFILATFICGLFVRFTFFQLVNSNVEKTLKIYFPSFDLYKHHLKFKFKDKHNLKIVQFANNGVFQIGCIMDEDEEFYVVFVTNSPNISQGNIYMIEKENCIILNTSYNKMENVFSKRGAGLLELL